jgi:hypothetical protein
MMKSGVHGFRIAAGEMLGQLLPRNVLRDAADLALKLQRDEVFREYLAARIWAALPVVFVFVLVSILCAIGIMFSAARLMAPPVPVWFRAFALLLGAMVGAGGVIAQTYVFLLWLEERAAHRSRVARGIKAAVPAGVFAYLKYSRALAPWVLVALCVVLPLAVLAAYAPLVALLLAFLAVLAPAAFRRFDS